MRITPNLIEELLHEDEGTSLDFKRDQYQFESANRETKSELLKDILAFANAFRRTDAYILIGVEDRRGGRRKVVGVETHLDDAKLQQFVNSKTQRTVTFSYHAVSHDGCSIGVIHIPRQVRPVFVRSDFGKLRRNVVYVRRGSSTAIADPDEIARMGAADVASAEPPSLALWLVDRESGESLGDSVSIDTPTWYDVPLKEAIPDYPPRTVNPFGPLRLAPVGLGENSNFLRDVAAYVETRDCFSVSLAMQNTGGGVIHDARLVLELHDADRRYELRTSEDCAPLPEPRFVLSALSHHTFGGNRDVSVTREGATWNVECHFGKVQPRATKRLQDDFLIGSRDRGHVTMPGKVFADNIDVPIPFQFQLSFQVGSQRFTVGDILRIGASIVGKD